MDKNVAKTAEDYSKYLSTDIEKKLDPVNKSIEGLLARLEEFQTMIYFAKQERISATELMAKLLGDKNDLEELFARVDAVEGLVEHVKSSLDSLESDLEKSEEQCGLTESKNVITNMFTPLFRRHESKKTSPGCSQIFKTEDYFHM